MTTAVPPSALMSFAPCSRRSSTYSCSWMSIDIMMSWPSTAGVSSCTPPGIGMPFWPRSAEYVPGVPESTSSYCSSSPVMPSPSTLQKPMTWPPMRPHGYSRRVSAMK